jgi:hypothetical protein
MNKQIGLAWFQLGIWKVQGTRSVEKERCPLPNEQKEKDIYLKHKETDIERTIIE